MSTIDKKGKIIINKRQISGQPKYKNIAVIDINITFPQVIVTTDMGVTAAVSNYYRNLSHNYYNKALSTLYKEAVQDYINSRAKKIPFRRHTIMSVFEVTYDENGMLSIYTDTNEFPEADGGNITRRSETWNMKTGEAVQLYSLLGPAYKTSVFNQLFSQISEQKKSGENFFADPRKNIFRYFDISNFYLTPEGLAVYFPICTIAPCASGITTFVIPYEKLGGLRIS